MKKRFLAMLLALTMCLALVPFITPSAQAYTTGDTYPEKYKTKGTNSVVDEWNFYNRQCTSFVAWCLNDRNSVHFTNQYKGAKQWGNACSWGATARRLGITVDMNPAVGSVAWWDKNVFGVGSKGHVAWVAAVNGNKVQIEEYRGSTGVFRAREINASDVSGYIHIKDIGLPSSGNSVIENGTYTLTPVCAPNSRLDIAGGSQDDVANVQIYTDNGSNAQKWDITSLGNGYYKLTAKCSGKVLDACYNNISSGQNVIQYTWDGGNYQQWKFKDAGDGYYYISPRCNENLCLDVYSAYSSDGTNVQVYTANQSNAQKWKLDKVGESGNSICSEEWIVSIPANYKLLCYSSKDATKNSTYIRAMTSSYKLSCTQKAQLSNGKTRYFFVSGDKKSLWFDFTNSMSVEYIEHPHLKGSFKYFEEEHPHYGHYICSVCGKEFKDNSSTWFTTGCSICVPSANETGNSSVTVTSWSEWSQTPAYASATREVETKTETERVKVSDAHTEYRYGGYVCFDYNDKKHECWCETYMRKRFGSAILRYSDWSTTRYSSTGTGWTCGSSCRGNHIGVDKYKNGTPWWAQYTLPGGEDYFWEESRTVEAQYETRTVTWYRYRDTTSQRVRITS